MKRMIAGILAVMVLATSFLFLGTLSASAETLCVKKVVSVVYDDSGSMSNDNSLKWAYASYAMQAFCGMLNKDDELYISYMSDFKDIRGNIGSYRPTKYDLSSSGIQGTVNTIRHEYGGDNTYIASVDAAMQQLSRVQDRDENTQYWLVVITDGEFQYNDLSAYVPVSEVEKKLKDFTKTTMANGTNPKITFMGIGNSESDAKAKCPPKDEANGLYVYTAGSANSIVNVMSEMAARVSGRTQLSKSEIKLVGSRKVEVTSEVPLFNIAVLSQKSSAKLTKATYKNGGALNVSRSASFLYPDPASTKYSYIKTDKTLKGGGFLVDNGNDAMKAGTYVFEFDQDITLDNLVVLIEPALEVRMVVMVDGEPASPSALYNLSAGKNISVECKVYEAGTDKEVPMSKLPKGTSCSVTVAENGKVVASSKDGALRSYELKETPTKITVSLNMTGFKPITKTVDFTPTKYVPPATTTTTTPTTTTTTEPPPVYEIKAQFGSDVKSVKYDNISSNTALTVEFSVYKDGQRVTDANEVRSLNPQVSASPDGNYGKTEITADGKIVFTPNAARLEITENGAFGVTVTCSAGGASASETYTVLTSAYSIIPVPPTDKIVKTQFYGNEVGVSFYILKDGEQLAKSEVEAGISVSLSEGYEELFVDVTVAEDGTITCIPRDLYEREYSFKTWFFNWKYYWGLPSDSVTVTLAHPYGTASAQISVEGETIKYLLCWVIIPFVLELLLVLFLIYWVIVVVTKPRFPKNAVVYTGRIVYNSTNQTTLISSWKAFPLRKYNGIKNYWTPSPKPKVVTVDGVLHLQPSRNGNIVCCEAFPWYRSAIKPYTGRGSSFNNNSNVFHQNDPKTVTNYIRVNGPLEISKIDVTNIRENDPVISKLDKTLMYAYKAKLDPGDPSVILKANVFCLAGN
ncbi:MAG: hypothetical protein IKU25_05635 [Clostridia bacterium]|nr:hypothetical protein [Clostridia bacterium]